MTASKEPLAKSTTPAVGLVTTPIKPLPTPLKKPPTPPSRAPSIGFVTTPVTPSKTPYEKNVEHFIKSIKNITNCNVETFQIKQYTVCFISHNI